MALVATDVAARGIDVEGVQCVIHYDPPENGKAYKHRSGRTARAGAYGSVISLVQKPQKNEFNKIQRQVGIRVKFTSPEFNELPERVNYDPPKRPRRMQSPLENKRRGRGRSRSRFRGGGSSKKNEKPSAQRNVEQQVEKASFFRKNKNRNKFSKNKNQRGKKKFPREEDRPRRRKKPTYGSKGLTTNEDGSPKRYGGKNKSDKDQGKYGDKPYRSGGNNSGKKPYRGGGNKSGGRPYRGGGKPAYKEGSGRGNQNNTSNKFRNKSNRNSNRKPSSQR